MGDGGSGIDIGLARSGPSSKPRISRRSLSQGMRCQFQCGSVICRTHPALLGDLAILMLIKMGILVVYF